jgi:hypothetical protein
LAKLATTSASTSASTFEMNSNSDQSLDQISSDGKGNDGNLFSSRDNMPVVLPIQAPPLEDKVTSLSQTSLSNQPSATPKYDSHCIVPVPATPPDAAPLFPSTGNSNNARLPLADFISEMKRLEGFGVQLYNPQFQNLDTLDRTKYIQWAMTHPFSDFGLWLDFHDPERIISMCNAIIEVFHFTHADDYSQVANAISIFKSTMIQDWYTDESNIATINSTYYPEDEELDNIAWKMSQSVFSLVLGIPIEADNQRMIYQSFGVHSETMRTQIIFTIKAFFRWL